MTDLISVEHEVFSDVNAIKQYFETLPNTIAVDFEVAVKYSDECKSSLKEKIKNITSKKELISIQRIINTTALDHPSDCFITHCSIATCNNKAAVIIIKNNDILKVVLDFLVTTDIKQLWHNLCYDGKHIYYHTNKFPKNYEDTHIYLQKHY